MEYDYHIEHIKGETNVWADLLSRWGAPSTRLGPTTNTTSSAKLLRLTPPLEKGDMPQDLNVTGTLQMPAEGDWPSLSDIAASQERHQLATKQAGDTEIAPHDYGDFRVFYDVDGRAVIPDEDKRLQLRLLAVAHQGPAGHRGRDVTYQALSGYCTWTTMRKDAAAFVRNCLQCIKDHTGTTVPRPLGAQLQAEKFNEVIHVDFCELGPSDTGHLYVLVAKDGLTQFVQLTMYKSATALDAAVGLLDWCKTFGIPSVIVSDGGPHFKNSLVQLLARELTFEHHLTLARSPWANGSVERLNRSMLAYFRKSLSQLRVPLERWPELLPYVQYIHNTTPSPSLGGRSPIECAFGYKPKDPLSLALWTGTNMKDAKTKVISAAELRGAHLTELSAHLQELHQSLTKAQLEQRERNQRRRKDAKLPAFDIGTYVLLGKRVGDREKLMLRWQGPYEIVDVPSPLIRGIRLLGKPDSDVVTVHVSRIRMFADSKLHVVDTLVETAQHDARDFEVKDIVGHRIEDSKLELLVHWLGFTAEDRTYEPVENLLDNANIYLRTAIKTYLRTAVESDPSLAQFTTRLGPQLQKQRKATQQQRKKIRKQQA